MSASDMVLYAEELGEIQASLARLQDDSNSKFAILIDRNGQQLAVVGETDELDVTSLASLTAGNVAATEGLAQLIGEPLFSNLFHEGERDNLHISVIGGRVILVLAFDERSSLGLVRLRVRQATAPLIHILDDMEKRTKERRSTETGGSPFAEITDADIDNLFSE
ncbi:MAG: roadblock/LC7 domain-containing protein [Acidobacteriota bacterium]